MSGRGCVQQLMSFDSSLNAMARAAHPSVPPLSRDMALATVGAILELVAIRVTDGETARLEELTEPLTEFVLRQVTPGLQ